MKAVLKIPKVTTTEVLLFITVLALQNFALLIPRENYLVPGLLKFSDLGTIMGLLFLFWGYFGVRSKRKVSYPYGGYIAVFLLMQVISGYVAHFHFGQPISYGIRAVRNLMVCFALYFPVTRALQLGVVRRRNLIRILFWVGTLELILYTLQFFLAGTVQFLHVDTGEVRFGSTRLRVPYLLPVVLGLYCYSCFLGDTAAKTGKKLLYIGYLGWSVFLLGGVCKHRAPTLILVCTIVLGYLLWKKKLSAKALVGIVGIAVGILVLANSTMVSSVMEALQRGKGNSLIIRSQGQLYYLERLKDSALFGFGFPNSQWSRATRAAGIPYHYYLADNGVMGFAYIYGLLGICWIGGLFAKLLKASWTRYTDYNVYFYLLYFVFETVNLYIGLHWYYYYFLPFVMAIVLLDYDVFREGGGE